MKKSVVDLVRGYIRRIPDDDFIFLHTRLTQRLGGDVAESVIFMEKMPEMDRWFSTAAGANDLYDMVDIVYEYLESDSRSKSRFKR